MRLKLTVKRNYSKTHTDVKYAAWLNASKLRRSRETHHHESTFDLSNVDGWIKTLADIHHYVDFWNLKRTWIYVCEPERNDLLSEWAQ